MILRLVEADMTAIRCLGERAVKQKQDVEVDLQVQKHELVAQQEELVRLCTASDNDDTASRLTKEWEELRQLQLELLRLRHQLSTQRQLQGLAHPASPGGRRAVAANEQLLGRRSVANIEPTARTSPAIEPPPSSPEMSLEAKLGELLGERCILRSRGQQFEAKLGQLCVLGAVSSPG